MGNFSESVITKVWEKAIIQDESKKNEWRKDYAGAWINRGQYGKDSDFGWEIDHAKPISKGGTDDIGNLVPLHWQNNRTKDNDYPNFKTSVTSSGTANIKSEKSWGYNA